MKNRFAPPATTKPIEGWRPLFLAAAMFALAGCGAAPSEPLPADHSFALTLDGQTIRVELAVTQEEQARGLMYREELDDDAGMLFISEAPRQQHFYMRNTPLPLDIGYFTPDGILQEVYALHPYDETTVSSRNTRIQFSLEMNQGWFSANGVRRGARLDLEEIADALERRGFSPGDFGLP